MPPFLGLYTRGFGHRSSSPTFAEDSLWGGEGNLKDTFLYSDYKSHYFFIPRPDPFPTRLPQHRVRETVGAFGSGLPRDPPELNHEQNGTGGVMLCLVSVSL